MNDIRIYKLDRLWYVNYICGEVTCSSFEAAKSAAKIIWETGLSPVKWFEMYYGEAEA